MIDGRDLIASLMRATLLVAVLGGCLYLGATAIVAVPGTQYGFAIVASLPLGGLLGLMTFRDVRGGIHPTRWRLYRRDSEPLNYWFGVAGYNRSGPAVAVCVVGLGAGLRRLRQRLSTWLDDRG